MNLLEETLEMLQGNGKSPKDVLWVGIVNHHSPSSYFTLKDSDCWSCDWNAFAAVAKDFNYHEGYGRVYVNHYLVVVGHDWWLERREYDGSEWWSFKTLPSKPTIKNDEIDLKDKDY